MTTSTPTAIRLASGVAVLALTAGLAHAQTVAPVQPLAVAQPAGAADGNQVYGQAFFAQFNLTNAEDLLRRIPGIASVLDSTGNGQGRGLGAGGDQILINGKRMASKSTDVASALRRIPGTSVERVELIRATSGDLEIRSEGLVVNIVLKAGAKTGGGGQGNFSLDQRFDNMGWRDFDGLFSYSDKIGNLTYTLGYEKNLFTPIPTAPGGGGGFGGEYTLKDRTEIYYYPNGQMQQFRPQQWERQHHKNIFTAQGAYSFQDGSQLNLNLLFQPHATNQTDDTLYTSYTSAGLQLPGVTDEYHSNRQMRTITEIGGEYETKLKSGTLNVIAIHNYTPVKTTDYRNRTFGSALTEVSRNVTKQVTQEDVIRSTFVMPLDKGQSLTVGGEVAKNSLNQRQQGYFDFKKNGRLETVPLTVAVVEEQRGELFVTHNWTINPKVTL
ncbi:MAG: TonB-dependent receptor plug domain-containing protein, partial [Alphaproteobacteria bacterium]